MKEKIKSRIDELTKEVESLQQQRLQLSNGINKLQKALNDADIAIVANQSKVNELKQLIEEPKAQEEPEKK